MLYKRKENEGTEWILKNIPQILLDYLKSDKVKSAGSCGKKVSIFQFYKRKLP